MARASPLWRAIRRLDAGPRHLCWLCWGSEHFAAVVAPCVAEARRHGYRVRVAAGRKHLESLGTVLNRYGQPLGEDAAEMPAGEPGRFDLPQPGGSSRRQLLVAVVSSLADAGEAGPVQAFEQAVARWVEADGSAALCVYDVAALEALGCLELHRCLETAAGAHRWAVLGGRPVGIEGFLELGPA